MAQLRTSTTAIAEMTLLQPTQTILIPVVNPRTAPPLLALAGKLIQEGAGRIVLLRVLTDDTSAEAHKTNAFQQLIAEHYQPHQPYSIEMVMQQAEDVASGIIDMAQQYRANLILLGLSYSIRGQVELGRIVETVIEQAPCDVGVYRSPIQPQEAGRIVIPVGGSIASKVILKLGIRLAKGYGFPCEALHVYSGISEDEAQSHVTDLLAAVPDHDRVHVNVTHGVNEANSVLSWADENDLLVIGYSERSSLEKWLYGDTSQRILDRARGPVLMVSRAIDDAEIQALSKRRLSWVRPLLTETEQEHVLWLAKDTVLFSLDYFVLLVIAALIAAVGLLLNSSAVVIGAMLVAPLMQPIITLGIALCTARLNLMRKATVTIILSVFLALAVGILVGLLMPPQTATEELLSRAYPSLLDAVVALAAGFIGAYATARKDIPAALAGVAIAAALVPPLCTVGLSIAMWEPRLAIGAALLFLTNLVSITIVAASVFFWMGMRPTRLDSKARRMRYATLLTGMLCVGLLVGGSLNFTQRPTTERISEIRLRTVFEPAELTNLRITRQEPLTVIATVRTTTDIPPESVKMAQVMLSEDLDKEVRLRIVVQRVIESGMNDNITLDENAG